MRVSVLGHAGTNPNYNNLVHVCSVIQYLKFLGVSVAFAPADAAARAWAQAYMPAVPLVDPSNENLESAEFVLRAFFPPWPARPVAPKVADLAIQIQDASGQADYIFAFYDGTSGSETHFVNMLSPLPPECIRAERRVVPKMACVFLGDDPLNRSAGLVATIEGGGYSAYSIKFPTTVQFWYDVGRADVLVASEGIPALLGELMGIPTLLVTNSASAHTRYTTMIIPRGLRGWEYLGQLSGLTDNNIKTEARELMQGSALNVCRQRALAAHGLLRGQEQGVRRIAEWIYRTAIGTAAPLEPLVSSPQFPLISSSPDPGRL